MTNRNVTLVACLQADN